DGRLTEATTYNSDGSLVSKSVHFYDSQGNETGYEIFNGSGIMTMKLSRSSNGTASTIYNDNGTILQSYASQASTIEYDSHGNWIKKSTPGSETHVGAANYYTSIMYRTITYY